MGFLSRQMPFYRVRGVIQKRAVSEIISFNPLSLRCTIPASLSRGHS